MAIFDRWGGSWGTSWGTSWFRASSGALKTLGTLRSASTTGRFTKPETRAKIKPSQTTGRIK